MNLHYSVVGAVKNGSSANEIGPVIGSGGNINMTPADGDDVRSFAIDNVDCTEFTGSGSNKVFFFNGTIPAGVWDVFVSDERIGFKSDYTQGPIGKPKIKSGRVTAGQLPLNAISNLSAMDSGPFGMPLLLCVFFRDDHERTGIAFHSSDVQMLKNLAKAIQEKTEKLLKAKGTWVTENDTSQEIYDDALKQWGSFAERAWTSGAGEETTVVPNNAFQPIP